MRVPKGTSVSDIFGEDRKQEFKPRTESSEEKDEEWPCLICGEPFNNSRSRELWVQCQECHKWAHNECTPGQTFVIQTEIRTLSEMNEAQIGHVRSVVLLTPLRNERYVDLF